MDFAEVMKRLGAFFIRLCSVEVSFGGVDFTFGSVFVFCGLVGFVCYFMRGLGE